MALEKKALRAADEHAARLSNRVKQLLREEERTKKITRETQKKIDAAVAARQRTEERQREKEAHHHLLEQQLSKTRAQILADKQKQEALRRRGLRKCFKEKAEQAEESREERSVREREAANLRLIDAVGALERKDTIRHQQELSQYKLKQFRQDKIRSVQEAYQSSVEKERAVRLQKERHLQDLAEQESRLLEKLRIRQAEQAQAEARLRAALSPSSRRPAPPQNAERLQGASGQQALLRTAPPSTTSATPSVSDESIAAAFSKYDLSGMGSIPVDCVAQLMASLGCPLTPAQTRQAVAQLDRSSSGSVAYGQFLLWWRG